MQGFILIHSHISPPRGDKQTSKQAWMLLPGPKRSSFVQFLSKQCWITANCSLTCHSRGCCRCQQVLRKHLIHPPAPLGGSSVWQVDNPRCIFHKPLTDVRGAILKVKLGPSDPSSLLYLIWKYNSGSWIWSACFMLQQLLRGVIAGAEASRLDHSHSWPAHHQISHWRCIQGLKPGVICLWVENRGRERWSGLARCHAGSVWGRGGETRPAGWPPGHAVVLMLEVKLSAQAVMRQNKAKNVLILNTKWDLHQGRDEGCIAKAALSSPEQHSSAEGHQGAWSLHPDLSDAPLLSPF